MRHPKKILSVLYRCAFYALCFADAAVLTAQEVPDRTDALGISVGGGSTFAHTDFQWTKGVPSPATSIGIHYYSIDFLSIVLDAQKGLLKGGAPLSDGDHSKTGFENRYYAFSLLFRFTPFALAGQSKDDGVLKALSSFYGGTGVGYMVSAVKANNIPNAAYGSQLRYNGGNLLLPLELGLHFKVARIAEAQLFVDINWRTNICFSDQLDGYVPTVAANRYKDAFSTCTGSLIYKFGW